MATWSTNTPLDQSSNANFQTWVNEVYNALVTQCGLTQTGDTGQMAVPCATAAPVAISTSAGYYVFKFNDTLQATAPIFFKLEFGSNSASANTPTMWITVGTGSNGSGTITWTGFGTTDGGVATGTRVAAGANVAGQTTTNYTSRYCYNATQGVCHAILKINMGPTTGASVMGFMIYRSVSATGAPNGNAAILATNSTLATSGANGPCAQVISYTNSTVYGPSSPNNLAYASSLYATPGWAPTNTSRTSTVGQIFPAYQIQPSTSTGLNLGITNAMATAAINEVALGATVTATVLGSTSLTYICVNGLPWANTSSTGFNPTNYGVLLLWQ